MGKTYLKGMVKYFFLLTAGIGLIGSNVAFGADNAILSGLEIKPDSNGSYDIILNTDKTVPIKTKANKANKLEINLKSIKPSEALNTTYGDVANIDLVLIKPQNDNIKIFIEGKDVASSNITFNSSSSGLTTTSKSAGSEIELNDPLDTYTPVVDVDTEDEGSSIYDNVSSLGIIPFLKNTFSKSNFGWLLSIAMFGVFIYSTFRIRRIKEDDINISLAMNKGIDRGLKERDLELYSNLSKASSLVEERMKAKRNQAYGIKEYQNSQINPNARFNKASTIKPAFTSTKSALQPKINATKSRTSQTTMQLNKQDTRQAELNLNNIKFLEAMTQIYEKSGRVDLANNLQNQLSQKKMNMRKYS